jgi:Carboxypeptidase regulatory-like domain/TonB-dependent Receptor Plug Domain
MNCKIGKLATCCAMVLLLVGFVSPASAQVFTGRIDVVIEDSTGGRLPGVNVDLTGPVNQSQVADSQGEAHFLNLPVGTYTVKAALQGFNTYTNSQVVVATGAATPLSIRLGVAGTAETVNVTAVSPIIDVKRETTTTNVTLEELQNIPTARDPWVVMQTVPTIYVDRVNVGGSESGQQSNYLGKGSQGTDNTWSIDGVPITDMGATGSTPTYYDFDMFQEMSITTGGADAQNPTPGVQLNMVLKKGSNTPHGNARYYFENENLQGNNMPVDLAKTIGGSNPECKNSGYTSGCGNRTDSYKDYGFDLGGPILKDKLWAWGTIGETHPKILTLAGTPDETILKNYAFKADGQINANVRGNFTFFEGNKEKFGRGASLLFPPETTWDQSGPTKYYKGEGNFVLGQNLFLAARYAYISGGFQLSPEGGNKSWYIDDAGVHHNSYYFYKTTRPQYFGGADGSYFAGRHEVKFGFSYRRTPVDSLSQVEGSNIITGWLGYPNMYAKPQYDYVLSTVGKYTEGFITDTISLNRLTLTAGIRAGRAASSLAASTTPAVTGVPLLPQVTTTPVENAYDFKTVTPRIGITYALDESRKTVARASYAMFAGQLPGNAASFVSAIQPYTYVYYYAVDRQTNGQPCVTVGANGCNGVADLNEINLKDPVFTNNVDLTHPGVFTTTNKIGDISAPRTQEFMAGVDRELMPNFGVSATFTYRYMNNFLWNPRNGVTAASYVQTGTFSGNFANVGSVSLPFYGATSALPGYTAQNRPDYHQRYLGFELSATKRMSNHWMGRFGFASTSWNEYFDSANAYLDPTRTPYASGEFTNYQRSGPLVNGGPVVVRTTGSGKSNIYLLPPKYQLTANGMYQGPWGFDFGANLVMRQGYGEPWYRSNVQTKDPVKGTKEILLVGQEDQFRLDTVATFDVRIEKMFKFATTNLALDLDVFNLFNAATTLGYQYDARLTNYNQTLEIMQPRIARLGVRFFF